MNTITSNPLYELRLSAIGTIESQGSLAWIGMRPPRISIVIGESASITQSRQDSGQQAECGKDEHGRERVAVDFMGGFAPPCCAVARETSRQTP